MPSKKQSAEPDWPTVLHLLHPARLRIQTAWIPAENPVRPSEGGGSSWILIQNRHSEARRTNVGREES